MLLRKGLAIMKPHSLAVMSWFLAFLCFCAWGTESIASFRELRYEGVVGQTDWYTCGPAAVATLLIYYFGIETSEFEILELSEGFMRKRGQGPGHGITALALKQALQAMGIETRGIRVTPVALADYFRRGGLPLILHVSHPQEHYLVVIGMIGEQVILTDPSWGRAIIPFSILAEEKWESGVVLVTVPSAELVQRVRAQQERTLAWAVERLSRLANLRETLP